MIEALIAGPVANAGGGLQNLSGKVAFITGGASGIGLGMATAFLRSGLRVVIADVSRENLDDAARRLEDETGEILLLPLDVTDRAAFAQAADAAEAKFGNICTFSVTTPASAAALRC